MNSTKPLVVVTNRVFPETIEILKPHARLDINSSIEPWPFDEVRERCRDATGILAFMTDRLNGGFFDACRSLRIVGAALKGYDNIDVDAATRAGICVTIVPDLLTVPTAELAVGLMIAVGRGILNGDRAIRERGFAGWRPQHYGAGLANATVGIVGIGCVGEEIAKRLSAFDCRLLGFDRPRLPTLPSPNVKLVDFESLLATSDYVVLALPLTSETRHIINARSLQQMKRGAYLINPGRGSLVDESAVADALRDGLLSGYATDVYECEDWAETGRPPLVHPHLRASGVNTVLTPHIGSAVTNIRCAIEVAAARSIVDVLQGRKPANALNY